MNDRIDEMPSIKSLETSFGGSLPITYETPDEELVVINLSGENHVIERGLLRKLIEGKHIAFGVQPQEV